MRQKNTVDHLEVHNQFQATPDEVRKSKREKAERAKTDRKQGQSDFQVKKKIDIKK